jgi:hypothetical protein
MIAQTSNRRRRFSWFKLSFVIVSHSSWCFVSALHSFCRVRIIKWSVQTSKRSSLLSNNLRTICADFKTIKSFVKWSQNDQVHSDRTFWILSHVWSFYFVFNSCTRKRHSTVIEDIIRDVMMIDDDDQRMMWHVLFFSQSENALILFDLIAWSLCLLRTFMSCLSWSSFLVCLAEITVRFVRELSVVREFMHF